MNQSYQIFKDFQAKYNLLEKPNKWNVEQLQVFICEHLGLDLKEELQKDLLKGFEFVNFEEDDIEEILSQNNRFEEYKLKLLDGQKFLVDYAIFLDQNQNVESTQSSSNTSDFQILESEKIQVINPQNLQLPKNKTSQQLQQIKENGFDQEDESVPINVFKIPFDVYNFDKEKKHQILEGIPSNILGEKNDEKLQEWKLKSLENLENNQIIVLEGMNNETQNSFIVQKSGITIGRQPHDDTDEDDNNNSGDDFDDEKDKEIVLNHKFVSQNHCQISYEATAKKFQILDLGSKAGTYIRFTNKLFNLELNHKFLIGGSQEIRVDQLDYKEESCLVQWECLNGDKNLKGNKIKFEIHKNKPVNIGFKPKTEQKFKINYKHIEENHAVIEYNSKQKQLFLKDISQSGCWLQLQKIQACPINQGDQVMIKPYQFRINYIVNGKKYKKIQSQLEIAQKMEEEEWRELLNINLNNSIIKNNM